MSATAVSDHRTREVFVYEVGLSQEDGRGNSGWRVYVVTEDANPSALLRVARLTLDDREAAMWTRLDSVKLLHKAHLDPEIAV